MFDAAAAGAIIFHAATERDAPAFAKVQQWEAAGPEHDPSADPALQPAPAYEFDQRRTW